MRVLYVNSSSRNTKSPSNGIKPYKLPLACKFCQATTQAETGVTNRPYGDKNFGSIGRHPPTRLLRGVQVKNGTKILGSQTAQHQ